VRPLNSTQLNKKCELRRLPTLQMIEPLDQLGQSTAASNKTIPTIASRDMEGGNLGIIPENPGHTVDWNISPTTLYYQSRLQTG